MAVPTWGMYGKPRGGKFDPDPYDQGEDVRRGPDLTVPVTGSREGATYDGGSQEPAVPYLPNVINTPAGGGAPVTQPTTPTGGGGLMDIIGGLLGGAGNLANSLGPLGAMLASYYASQRSADSMEGQADKYGALGREAAGMASPVSNARRGEWDQRLTQLYEDPQAFLEGNPEYQAALKTGSAGIDRMNAISRSGMSGKGVADIMTFASDLGAKHIGKERDDLMNMAGYQFNPANAGSLLMEGGRLEGDARQAALAARLYPLGDLFRSLNGGNNPNNKPGGGPGGSNPIGSLLGQIANMFKNPSGGGSNVQDLLRMFGPGVSSISGLFPGTGNINIPGLEETYGNVGAGNWNFGRGGDGGGYDYGDVGDGGWDWGSIGDGGLGINWDDFFNFNPGLDAGSILGMFDIGGPW